jgi:prepilin peptidase CpaA
MKWSVLIQLTPLLIMLAVAAAIDARTRRIPNWLTFGLLIAGVMRAAALGWSSNIGVIGGVGHSLLGVMAGASIPLVLFALKAVGGGDVKLMAAIGAWIGPEPVIIVMLVEKVVGLVIVLAQALYEGRLTALFRNSALIASNFAYASEIGIQNVVESGKSCRSISKPLPFAVPALIATVLVALMNTLAWS